MSTIPTATFPPNFTPFGTFYVTPQQSSPDLVPLYFVIAAVVGIASFALFYRARRDKRSHGVKRLGIK